MDEEQPTHELRCIFDPPLSCWVPTKFFLGVPSTALFVCTMTIVPYWTPREHQAILGQANSIGTSLLLHYVIVEWEDIRNSWFHPQTGAYWLIPQLNYKCSIKGEWKIVKFSNILGCMEQSTSCPHGIHRLLWFPQTTLPTVHFIAFHKTGLPNMA